MYTGNDLRETKNYSESSRRLSSYFSEGEKRRPEMRLLFAGYRRLGLSRVRVAEGKNYSKRMKEIKGKSILVRVSGTRLYSEHDEYQFQIFSLFFL